MRTLADLYSSESKSIWDLTVRFATRVSLSLQLLSDI